MGELGSLSAVRALCPHLCGRGRRDCSLSLPSCGPGASPRAQGAACWLGRCPSLCVSLALEPRVGPQLVTREGPGVALPA